MTREKNEAVLIVSKELNLIIEMLSNVLGGSRRPKAFTETKVESTYGAPSTTEAPPLPKVVTETKVEATYGAPSTTRAPPVPM